ncbi:MAG: hypothetical protein Q9227_004913 [Pyrenula ochraceoflavens]
MFSYKSNLTPRNENYPFISPNRFQGILTSETVLITGATHGIGLSTTHAFASAGASIGLVSRNSESLSVLVSDLEALYPKQKFRAIPADVSEPDSGKQIVTTCEAALGPVSILIANAGITRYSPLAYEKDIRDWWRVLEINLLGAVSLIHAVLPGMIARKKGTISCMSSSAGALDIPYCTAYSVSKAAVIKLIQDLHVELSPHNIALFTVHPGSVETGMGEVSGATNLKALETEPKMAEVFGSWPGEFGFQKPELAAGTFVCLAADERCRKTLSGLYIDSQFDLEQMVKESEKEGRGKIGAKNLYRLKLEEL